jgi:hypothetical protein
VGQTLTVTYDLAVWEGERPESDADGAATFRRFYDTYLNDPEAHEPTPRIRA